MPSSRKGHFVQIWRPVQPPGKSVWAVKEAEWRRHFRHVLGRSVSIFRRPVANRTGSVEEGWQNVSRELPRSKARKIASAYKKAGFPSRVKLFGSPENKVTDTFGEVKG